MSDKLITIIDSLEENASYWRNECDSSDEAQAEYARGELHCTECDLKILREAFKIVAAYN